ncbi:hypothetical protein [Enterococcus avium]|uniref:hypothetical protein n=1 Tax=Enterococcus avium TaxID=33945 RepID=UPI0027042EEF|nr:hypothetical protein [Enterococcus avium]MDO7798494.1 hypothetical protein [Enterococcus avium]
MLAILTIVDIAASYVFSGEYEPIWITGYLIPRELSVLQILHQCLVFVLYQTFKKAKK